MKLYQVDDPRWNEVVRSFDAYDVHDLQEYAKAFAMTGAGEPCLFYAESGSVRGFIVMMKRDIATDPHFAGRLETGRYFDLASPYGYGGWVLQGDGDPAPIYADYRAWCLENHVVCEFVRFDLFSESRDSYYGDVTPRMGNVVCTLSGDLDTMLKGFEHKVRKNYKKACGGGLSFIAETGTEHLEDYLRIYYATMDRDHADEGFYFDRAFYAQLNRMEGHCLYCHALLNGQVISTELVLMANGTMYSFLGGTDSNFFAYRPNDFLKCEIIRWGLEHGYRRFVLGGGYGQDDGIFRYKKAFAPEGIMTYYTGSMIFDEQAYEALTSLRSQDDLRAGYFPVYRS